MRTVTHCEMALVYSSILLSVSINVAHKLVPASKLEAMTEPTMEEKAE